MFVISQKIIRMKYNKLLILISGLFLLTTVSAQETEQWGRFELTLKSPQLKNGFTEVTFTADFFNSDTSYSVTGFYDGNNIYKLRFMPQTIGKWQYKTHSNIKELNNVKGAFNCIKAANNNYGIVKVSDTYNFK